MELYSKVQTSLESAWAEPCAREPPATIRLIWVIFVRQGQRGTLTAFVPPAMHEVALKANKAGVVESLGLVSLLKSRLALLLSAVELGEQLLRQAVLELDAIGSPGSPTLLYYRRTWSEATELACQSG
jgi:hypothetical protein